MSDEKEIVSVTDAPARHIVTPEDAKKAMQNYQEICKATLIPYDDRKIENGVIVQESDYARLPIKRREGGGWVTEYKDAPKKSAWRKLARFYGVSTEILEKTRTDRDDGSFLWEYTVKATDPNGQHTTGEGVCDSNEVSGDRRKEHDTKTRAHTRAKSRAISDLIGFGQVSAEELTSPKYVESEQLSTPTPKPKARIRDPPR